MSKLFKIDSKGKLHCHSQGRATGNRDTKKFHYMGGAPNGLPGDRPSGALHHMIPWEQLGRVLAAAINQCRNPLSTATNTVLDELLKVCYQADRITSVYVSNLKSAIGQIANGIQATSNTLKDVDIQVDDKFSSSDELDLQSLGNNEMIHDLVNHWCWMPGNLFLGSASRSDDPGSFAFDHPPANSGCYAHQPLDEVKARVADVFNLYAFLEVTRDSYLQTDEGCNELVEKLTPLIEHKLYDPLQLLNGEKAGCFVSSGGKYHIAKPLVCNDGMRADLNERRRVLAFGNDVKSSDSNLQKSIKDLFK